MQEQSRGRCLHDWATQRQRKESSEYKSKTNISSKTKPLLDAVSYLLHNDKTSIFPFSFQYLNSKNQTKTEQSQKEKKIWSEQANESGNDERFKREN